MQYTCPISDTHVDEHVVRINALIVLLLLLGSFTMAEVWRTALFLFLSLDYFLKWRKYIQYSSLARISKFIAHTILHWKAKAIDFEPKRFAAMLGFFLSLILSTLSFLHLSSAVTVLTIIFSFLTFLESVFNTCVGCILYSFIQKIR